MAFHKDLGRWVRAEGFREERMTYKGPGHSTKAEGVGQERGAFDKELGPSAKDRGVCQGFGAFGKSPGFRQKLRASVKVPGRSLRAECVR
jgi:hypothetical protein